MTDQRLFSTVYLRNDIPNIKVATHYLTQKEHSAYSTMYVLNSKRYIDWPALNSF